MSKELTKEEIEKLYLRIECKKENPEKWGWYNTDKGKLFWYDLENSWSCNDERLSEEYPKYWYKEYSDQNTKPLIDEIAELKSKVSNWMDKYIEVNEENKKLQSELKDKESVNENFSKQHAKIIESLSYVRDNPKTWKAGGIGGQDQYAGMPPMLRYIDEIISYLTNQNK